MLHQYVDKQVIYALVNIPDVCSLITSLHLPSRLRSAPFSSDSGVFRNVAAFHRFHGPVNSELHRHRKPETAVFSQADRMRYSAMQ